MIDVEKIAREALDIDTRFTGQQGITKPGHDALRLVRAGAVAALRWVLELDTRDGYSLGKVVGERLRALENKP